MRASIFALLMALPVAGFAQTPRDLARLSFGADVARLRGDGVPSLGWDEVGVRIAATERPRG